MKNGKTEQKKKEQNKRCHLKGIVRIVSHMTFEPCIRLQHNRIIFFVQYPSNKKYNFLS